MQSPRNKFVRSGGGGGSKDERVTQIGEGVGGACLKRLILLPLNDWKCSYKYLPSAKSSAKLLLNIISTLHQEE